MNNTNRDQTIDFANGGDIRGMIRATDTYLKVANDETKVMTGHGALAKKADAKGAAPRRAAEEATGRYDDGLALTIAVAYGGHDEITDAVRALLREAAVEGKALADAIETVTPAAIARHLYMAGQPDPDLIIRASGESRLSGFLLWQSAYGELYFTDVNWPAFPQERLSARDAQHLFDGSDPGHQTKALDRHWKLTGSPLARFLMITGRPQTRLGFWF